MIPDIQTDLEMNIWNTTRLLRGAVDEFHIYLYFISLLGLKRYYDIHYELEKSWKKLYYSTSDLGNVLNKAFQEIDDKYLSKEGLVIVLDFNQDQFPDLHARDIKLRELLEIIGNFSFTDPEFQSSEKMMQFCQDVNDKFLERYSSVFGQTLNGSMISLVTYLIDVQKGEQVYDPFCKNGMSLISIAAQNALENRENFFYGQIDDLPNFVRYNLNAFLVGVSDIDIKVGDVISEPSFVEHHRMKKFDKIVTSIPMGTKNWGYEFALKDPYNRFSWVGLSNLTNSMKGEYAYLLHCIASLADEGIMVAVVPNGVLFWERTVKNIRMQMLTTDIIEAVIQLPPKMFYGISIPVALLIIKNKKPEERQKKVLFIDASKDFWEGRFRNILKEEIIEKIVTAYHGFKSVEGFSVIKYIHEIAQNEFNLSVDRYFPKEDNWKPEIDVDDSINRLNCLRKEKDGIYLEMQECLRKLRIQQKTATDD